MQTIDVSYADNKSKRVKINVNGNNFIMVGDLVAISNEDDETKYSILEKDNAFDNDISVKYDYDAKKIEYPMIGEYIITKNTKYYKVTLKYKNNSITLIDECKVEKLELDDIEDLMLYKINLIYNEDMEVICVYAVNELNKFENRVALVKDKKMSRDDNDKYTYKVVLSITDAYVTSYEISADEFEKYRVGDIVTFSLKSSGKEEDIIFEEAFKHEFIGYKRDLIVKDFDLNSKRIIFNDESIMDLNEDIYDWNGNKINLNKYRIVVAKVSKSEDGWHFNSLKMSDRDNLIVENGDRIAIGEINGVIVIYRGYED